MALARRIRSILVEDERTKDFSFDVLDNNRVVTLSGIVPNEKACQKAGQVVKEQEGVIEVINDLNLEGEQEQGDRPQPRFRLKISPVYKNCKRSHK